MENNPLWCNITNILQGKIRERDITDELELRNNGERLLRERETIISNNIRAIERIEDRDFSWNKLFL